MSSRRKYPVSVGKYPLFGGTPIGMFAIVLGVIVIFGLTFLSTFSLWCFLPIIVVTVIACIANKKYEKNTFYFSKKREYGCLRTDLFVKKLHVIIKDERTTK